MNRDIEHGPPTNEAVEQALGDAIGLAVEGRLTQRGRKAILRLADISAKDFDAAVQLSWLKRFGHLTPDELATEEHLTDPART
jgi:hypothetical protein